MIQQIQSIRGMHDYLPIDTKLFQYVEDILKKILKNYGYYEIRLPIIESASLFKRAIGNETDVVEKEMYTFIDLNGDCLALRPEGTSGCVRSYIENNLFQKKKQSFWYIGPMFRHERPQMGRYRQFYQLGIEVFGQKGPAIDAELIILITRFWNILNINKYLSLELNSIGSLDSRTKYKESLIKFLTKNLKHLDNDCKRRLRTNPMRILDTKNSSIKELLKDAPSLIDYLDGDSKKHFDSLCKLLDIAKISYKINPLLVRGLDYYNKTVFEWVTNEIGSKRTICAGGRYDLLIEQLGGKPTCAIGLAIGIDRLILLMKRLSPNIFISSNIDAYLIIDNEIDIQSAAIIFSENIRNKFPSLKLIADYSGENFKKQLNRAYSYNAHIAIIFGKKELQSKKITIKNLITGDQETLEKNDIYFKILSIIYKNKHKNYFC